MRRIRIAEWILGLVTSRDRAASTAGDFAEAAAGRGVVWFWSAILRTAASFLWLGITEKPLRMTSVAAAGLALDIAGSLLLAGFSGIMFFIEARNGHPGQMSFAGWIIALDLPELILSVLIGIMLALCSRGRELSACLAYSILGSIFSFVMMFVAPGGLGFSGLLWVFLSDVAKRTPILACAVWSRHRRLVAR